MTMTMDSTLAKMGRSMKKCESMCGLAPLLRILWCWGPGAASRQSQACLGGGCGSRRTRLLRIDRIIKPGSLQVIHEHPPVFQFLTFGQLVRRLDRAHAVVGQGAERDVAAANDVLVVGDQDIAHVLIGEDRR